MFVNCKSFYRLSEAAIMRKAVPPRADAVVSSAASGERIGEFCAFVSRASLTRVDDFDSCRECAIRFIHS